MLITLPEYLRRELEHQAEIEKSTMSGLIQELIHNNAKKKKYVKKENNEPQNEQILKGQSSIEEWL